MSPSLISLGNARVAMDWNMVREAPLGARVKHVFSVKPPVRMMILMNHW